MKAGLSFVIGGIAVALAATAVLTCSHEAAANQSVNQQVNTSIKYDTPLSITTNVAAIDYGTVKASQAGTYAVDTTGALTASGGGVALYGTPVAASFNVIGSTTQTVVIGVVSYSGPSFGTTASLARCAYNGGAEAACNAIGTVAAPGAGKVLLVGATVTSDGTATAGQTATPFFTLSFTYT